MPTDVFWETIEQHKQNQQSFNGLVASVEDLGFSLTENDKNDLEEFYLFGAKNLNDNFPEEQYAGQLSYATGLLLNKLRITDPSSVLTFDTFRSFLRSLCPLDPFC